MTGGMKQKSEYDGYSSTPAELEAAEQSHDDLKALEKGLQALQKARAWLESGGYVIPRLAEDIGQIKLAIGLLRSGE